LPSPCGGGGEGKIQLWRRRQNKFVEKEEERKKFLEEEIEAVYASNVQIFARTFCRMTIRHRYIPNIDRSMAPYLVL